MADCASKRVFTDMRSAKKAAKKQTAAAGRKIYFYPCPVCAQYHLTKKNPREFARLKHQRMVLNGKRRDSGVWRKR